MTEQPRDIRTGRFVPKSAEAAEADERMNLLIYGGFGAQRPAPASTSPSPSATAGVFEPVSGPVERGDWLQVAYQRRRWSVPLPEHRNPESPR